MPGQHLFLPHEQEETCVALGLAAFVLLPAPRETSWGFNKKLSLNFLFILCLNNGKTWPYIYWFLCFHRAQSVHTRMCVCVCVCVLD